MDFTDKLKAAKKLGIVVPENTTEVELDELIAAQKAKVELEKEQARIKKEDEKKAASAEKKAVIILKDVDGEEVDQKDYFFPNIEKGITDTAPSYFNRTFGMPVDREDLLEVFNNIFDKKKKFLFYKCRDKEVYLVIVPIKFATTVNRKNDSIPGDFQKHAVSFINEGSVNIESLKMKLTKVAHHPSISKEPLA
jgi:hypothetical protein